MSALRRWWLDVVGVLAAVTYALPSLGYRFGMDQPLHWYIGRRWLDGEMPYVSGVSTKPPGAFFVHSLSILVFGDHQGAVRAVDLLFVLAAGALIATFRARRRKEDGTIVARHPRRPGEIGAACLAVGALAYTFFDWFALGHPDLWQGVFMLAAAWVVVRAPDGIVGWRRALAAGAVACVAVSFKHVAFVSGVAFGVVVVGAAITSRRWRDAAQDGLAYTAGVALVLGVVLLPFVVTGTFDVFWEVMVEFILAYAESEIGRVASPHNWPTWEVGLAPMLLALGTLLGGLALRLRDRVWSDVLVGSSVLLVMLCGLLSIGLQDRMQNGSFAYHWLALVPALGLGLAWGLRQVAPRRGGVQLAVIAGLTLLALVAEPLWTTNPGHSYVAEWDTYLDVARGEVPEADRWRAYERADAPLDSYIRHQRVANRISAVARPGDTLCLDGYFGVIYQLTSMRCTSRFITPPYVMYAALPRWGSEYMRMWEVDPPTFFVTFSDRPQVFGPIEERGYELVHVLDGQEPHYVILERIR